MNKSPLWQLTLLLYVLLCLTIVIDSLQLEKHRWLVLALQLVPLLLLAPGLWQKYYRSYSWLCFLILLYFTNYVVQVYAPSRGLLDIIGLILSIFVFISAMLTSRSLQRQ